MIPFTLDSISLFKIQSRASLLALPFQERFDHAKVDKEKESIQFELTKALKQISEAEAAITSQKAEIEKLNHIINEADSERVRQKQEYEIVVNERDILGTQLIRRNDELSLLYEKIKIQQVRKKGF